MFWGGYYGGMAIFWWIFWVLAVIAFFAFVMPHGREGRVQDEALGLLRRRYAAGEIDEAEFQRRTEFLRGSRTRRTDVRPPQDRSEAAAR